MIHGNSTDPVYLKKIALNVWLLRDEIEVMAAQKMQADGLSRDAAIEQIQKDYTPSNVVDLAAVAEQMGEEEGGLAEDSELDDSEDEMAKALAEAEAGEESAEVESEEGTEESAPEDGEDGPITIIKPKLPQEKIIVGRTMLSEIYMDKMFFFSDHHFLDGQSIVIEFQIPKRFIVSAQVVYCRNYNMKSRIIKTNKLLFRVCVNFSFIKKGERTLLRDFLQSVEPKVEKNGKKGKQKSADADEDDIFSELDNL